MAATSSRASSSTASGASRQRYREGQEDQLGALGLVVNAIILWNTIYIDAALYQLRAEGFDVRDGDVASSSTPATAATASASGAPGFSREPAGQGAARCGTAPSPQAERRGHTGPPPRSSFMLMVVGLPP